MRLADRILKLAEQHYAHVFPELATDKNKEMLFDAMLAGITY